MALVPSGVVTVMSTVATAFGGMSSIVIWVGLPTVKHGAVGEVPQGAVVIT